MGSFKYIKIERYYGKVNTSLNKKLENVKWGEFRIGDLFEKLPSRYLGKVNKFESVSKIKSNVYNTPVVYAKSGDNGIMYWAKEDDFTVYNNVLSIVYNGAIAAGLVYAHSQKTGILAESYFIKLKDYNVNFNVNLFLQRILEKTLYPKYSRDYLATWSGKVENDKIQLPTKNNKIDFDFMETFITELEKEKISQLDVYLEASGLKDYDLIAEEEKVLADFEKGKIVFGEFSFKNIFNKIAQGRRLTKNDQILGDIPFVMAGRGDTGISNYISNPVASFPKNSITIDILGNTFYRDYFFGAGDDTGVYWNDSKDYSRKEMLFMSTSMEKSLFRQFDFGKKLRSSQSLNFKMKLPIKNKEPDYKTMGILISAIQKQIIKDVVLYTDNKLDVTK